MKDFVWRHPCSADHGFYARDSSAGKQESVGKRGTRREWRARSSKATRCALKTRAPQFTTSSPLASPLPGSGREERRRRGARPQACRGDCGSFFCTRRNRSPALQQIALAVRRPVLASSPGPRCFHSEPITHGRQKPCHRALRVSRPLEPESVSRFWKTSLSAGRPGPAVLSSQPRSHANQQPRHADALRCGSASPCALTKSWRFP